MSAEQPPVAKRPRAADLLLGMLGAAWGAVSWWFPFGHDQAQFYYVGRAWCERGALPYRDVFEQKPPLLLFVNGALARMFGEGPMPIHIAEWVLVSAVAVLSVKLAKPATKPAPPGAYGAVVLLCNVFFFGFFTYRETANCEAWVVFFLASAALAARSTPRLPWAAAVAGALTGLALLAKPPALLLVPLPVFELWTRGRATASTQSAACLPRTTARHLCLFAGCAVAVNAAVVAYFALHGALPAMADVLIGVNGYYNLHERPAHTAMEYYRTILLGVHWFQPYSTLLAVTAGLGVGLPLVRGRHCRALAARYAKPTAVLLLAYGSMVIQFKFLLYHFETLLLPVALFGALLYEDWLAAAASQAARRAAAPAFGAAVLAFFFASGFAKDEYLTAADAVVRHLTGQTSELEFLRAFSANGDIDLPDSKLAGDWIASHSTPDEPLLVRGYEAQIYYFARRHYTGRFDFSTFLTLPSRAYHRSALLREDYEALARTPPHFVVALSKSPYPIEATPWFVRRGYGKRASFGPFDVLELVDPAAMARVPPAVP